MQNKITVAQIQQNPIGHQHGIMQQAQLPAPQNITNQTVPLEANIQIEDQPASIGLSDVHIIDLINQCEKENEEIMLSQQEATQVMDGVQSKFLKKQMVS